MSEGDERQQAPETGDETASETTRKAERAGEDTSPAQGTPPIEGGGRPGQTQTPAPEEDVGVPEELEDRTE
jgi:hypothetical protein